jgi:uncharacterized protein YjbI with pentapeptide repeats|tara:strand:+ start:900 stop:1295 length:396 start_codon:yes stop_codon:yes gene_type:complete
MRNLLLISALLFSFNGWAYSETDLAKLKATGACEGCDLSGAILSYLNLGGANLSGANLSGADLRKTSFSMLAILSGADLSGAILAFANLSGADLRGADFTGAFVGSQARLAGAKYCKTKIRRKERNDDCEE